MGTPTGVSVLDGMLNGGLPEGRATLLMGGPGTGKTTLAMHYLQEGLERNEDCLFVSTEQTPAELRDSFAPYGFQLDHELLSIETIHATMGSTIESEEEELVLESLDDAGTHPGSSPRTIGGDDALDPGRSRPGKFGQYQTPFTRRGIQELLERYDHCDRVVLDSISGLEVMTSDPQLFRRAILDLIRQFTDRFGATTLLTAEETNRPLDGDDSSGLVQFNTHGVIRLWQEQVNGDFHRFIQIKKMRGVNHATQAYEMEFTPQGVQVVPEKRVPSAPIDEYDALTTGISGLDDLCGGGLLSGGTALLEHDGRANVNTIVANIIIESVRDGQAIVLIPPSGIDPEQLDGLIEERVGSIPDLLAEDQLFVLDLTGNWTAFDRNVFTIQDYERTLRRLLGGLQSLVSWKMKRIFKTVNERRGTQPALAVVYTEAMLQEFSPNQVRQMHQWAKKNLFVPADTVLFVQNPAVMDESLAEFFVLDAQQALRTWIHDNSLQYISLEKSPTGHLGQSKLVEHVDYPPYVRVQRTVQR